MSFSTAPAATPVAPRAAARWLRDTAVPVHERALVEVDTARARSVEHFTGQSSAAYSAHTGVLALRLQRLIGRLERAAALCEAYAERLTAHEALLSDVRARAVAAGLDVRGHQVGPAPGIPTLLSTTAWSELGTRVLAESESLAQWVRMRLDATVDSFRDDDTRDWLVELGAPYATAVGVPVLTEVDRSDLLRRVVSADDLGRLSRGAGPAGLAVDAIVALEGDEPVVGLLKAAGGFTMAALTAAALPAGAGALTVVGLTALATVGGAMAVERHWERIPEPARDSVEDWAVERWDDTKGLAADGWDEVSSWLPD